MMKEEIELILATLDDAELIHQMKYEAFLPLYEKYHDDETSPAKESIDKVIWKLSHPNSEYYLIRCGNEYAGAIRVARKRKVNLNGVMEFSPNINYVSPIFILPKFQNKGIGQMVLNKIFELYQDTAIWKLDTIKQEAGNCHLYEKCGFVRVGVEHIVNEKMTLIDYEKSNLQIRCMTMDDYEQVYDLWIHTPGMGLNNLDDSKEGIAKYLKRNPTSCFVATVGNKIVGIIMSGHDGRRGFIHHTTVSEGYRKLGIGRQLVDHALQALEEEGINKVALVAFTRNELGNAFWESVGFSGRDDLVYRNRTIRELVRIDT